MRAVELLLHKRRGLLERQLVVEPVAVLPGHHYVCVLVVRVLVKLGLPALPVHLQLLLELALRIVGVQEARPVAPLPELLQDELDLAEVVHLPAAARGLYLAEQVSPHGILGSVL